MSRYAAQTTVSSEKSRAEIEGTLRRYGASAFASAWSPGRADIGFEMNGKRIRFRLPMPDRQAKRYTTYKHSSGKLMPRSESAGDEIYEQDIRQRWRALALVIKAKLEAVDAGITIFEDEFLSHIVLPNGETVGQWFKPQLDIAYQSGSMPALLPDYSDRSSG